MRTKYATVKDTEGRVYELRPTVLFQPAQHLDINSKLERRVARMGLRKQIAMTYLYWVDGLKEQYKIKNSLNGGRLAVGCREFGPTATKKLLKWAKAKKSAKKGK